jgi:hypothetical protein
MIHRGRLSLKVVKFSNVISQNSRTIEPSLQKFGGLYSTVLPTRQQTSIAVDFDRINPYNFSFVVRQTIKEKRYFLKYFQHNDYS